MLPYLVAGAIGAIWASSRGPNASYKKARILGPKTGISYEADEFKAGVVLVKAKDGTTCVFTKKQPPEHGFVFQRGEGNPAVIRIIKSDFIDEKPEAT